MNLKEKTVVIDNKTYRYSKIVMLESKNKAKYDELFLSSNKLEKCIARGTVTCRLNAQHLYFLSTDKICEGDWVIENGFNRIFQVEEDSLYQEYILNCYKVITTTNPECNLPKPSDSFLQVYIDAYNKSEKIENCLVEYIDNGYEVDMEGVGGMDMGTTCWKEVLELKVTKGEITIRKVKDSWSMKEIIAIHKANCERLTNSYTSIDIEWINSML